MVAVQVNPATPFWAWPIVSDLPDLADPTKPSVLDAFAMAEAIAPAGYKTKLEIYQETLVTDHSVSGGRIVLEMVLIKPGYPEQPTIVGGFVVFDGVTATVVDAATYQEKYQPST